jgi:ribosomal-protein-alanine N-acetyltransferase
LEAVSGAVPLTPVNATGHRVHHVSNSQVIVLETARLFLRRLTLDDLDRLAMLYRDSDVRRYFPEGVLTSEETRQELEHVIDVLYRQYGYGLWATIHRESGELIGRCGLLPWKIDGRSEVEVAYLLAKRHWRQGLGTEAAQAIRDYAFNVLNLPRLICLIHHDNVASQNVAGRIGMTFEREGRDDKGPYLLYSMSKP